MLFATTAEMGQADMVNHPPVTTSGLPFGPARLARDYAYVMPGFFISLFAFVILVPLTALSLGTLVIWVGALLLPLTLYIASGFAELSRTRLRHWGVDLPDVPYRPTAPGVAGLLRRMIEPRRWLDLVFETVVAFPLRTLTFAIATTWTAAAAGGITFPLWGVFVPGRGLVFGAADGLPLSGLLLEAFTGGAAPDGLSRSFGLEAVFNLTLGIVFLVTLPFVMRGLALLDAITAAAALGTVPGAPASDAPAPRAPTERAARRPDRPRARPFASGEGWAWIAAAAAGVVSIAVGWPVLAAVHHVHVAVALPIVLASAASLLLCVRWPLAGAVLQTLAATGTVLAVGPSALPWPVTGLILQAILVLLVALRHSWPLAVIAWALPQAAVLAATVALGVSPAARAGLSVSASVSLGVLAVGAVTRQLVRSRGALREERRTSADLSAQREELAERNRIAQELHDVVAHSMSVISVQATTAKYRLPGMDPSAEREFQSIAASSRQALTEMRGLLAVLRSRDEEAQLAPQPTLSDLPTLIEATRRSGARISFRIDRRTPDDAAAVPPATGLTAYRVVQEALSNAVRHAPGSEIDVVVAIEQSRLVIEVVNGAIADAAAHGAAPGAGLGLAGVGERTQALGGTVEAGPTAENGFRVRVVLPLG
jgi:signal transduction histidine kinase